MIVMSALFLVNVVNYDVATERRFSILEVCIAIAKGPVAASLDTLPSCLWSGFAWQTCTLTAPQVPVQEFRTLLLMHLPADQ